MSTATHLVSRGVSVSGYGPSDGGCLPCSGVSGGALSLSPRSTCSDYKGLPQVKFVPLRCAYRGRMSSICSANSNSNGQRRNPDFPRQNRHGFSRNRNRQNEERDSTDNLEDTEIFSKNGPLLSASGAKFQATATPGPREREIVQLFRKVQAQLRERAALKEEKKVEESQGPSKQNETVDSLLKLLRKHSVQHGKRSSGNSDSSRDFAFSQPEQNGPIFEDKGSPSLFDSDNIVKEEVKESVTPPSVVRRPASNFQRRSPVPRVKYQPIFPDGSTPNSSPSYRNVDQQKKEARRDSIPEPAVPKLNFVVEPEIETEIEAEQFLSDGGVFDDDISDDETSEIEDENEDLEGEQSLNDIADLSGMKLPELRSLAKSRGLKGFSKLKKRELVELLTSSSL